MAKSIGPDPKAGSPAAHGRRNISIHHPNSEPFYANMEQLKTESQLWTVLRRYIKGGMFNLSLHFSFLSKEVSSFTQLDI